MEVTIKKEHLEKALEMSAYAAALVHIEELVSSIMDDPDINISNNTIALMDNAIMSLSDELRNNMPREVLDVFDAS